MPILLHDIGIPGWFVWIFLLLSVVSTYFVVYGIYSLARYWEYLDRRLKIIFATAPAWAFLIALLPQDHGLLISFPFGLFTGLPLWFLISFVLESSTWVSD